MIDRPKVSTTAAVDGLDLWLCEFCEQQVKETHAFVVGKDGMRAHTACVPRIIPTHDHWYSAVVDDSAGDDPPMFCVTCGRKKRSSSKPSAPKKMSPDDIISTQSAPQTPNPQTGNGEK